LQRCGVEIPKFNNASGTLADFSLALFNRNEFLYVP